MTKKHKCDSMKTVGTETNTKTNIKFQNGYQGRRNRERNIERKTNINMSNFEQMTIPIEADGIVDDQKEFEKQQAKNEAKLLKEIAHSVEAEELQLGDYEDIEGDLVRKPNVREYSAKALDKVQARKIGRVAILFSR